MRAESSHLEESPSSFPEDQNELGKREKIATESYRDPELRQLAQTSMDNLEHRNRPGLPIF